VNQAKISLWFLLVTLIALVISPLQEALPQESAEQLYEAALFKKEAEGDLEGAIQLFRKIIAEYPENRKLGARAQLQIGMCYEKFGLKEAFNAYKKVVDSYPEQTEEVKKAREKLYLLLRAQTVIEKADKEFNIRQVWECPGAGYIFGACSPDGRYISYRDWRIGDIAVLDLRTGKKRHLTHGAYWYDPVEFTLYSQISPDSKQVAYSWYNFYSTYDLRLIGIDGKGSRVLYSNKDESVHPAAWSSDGKRIIIKRYIRKDETFQIACVSVIDGSIRVLKTMGKDNRRYDYVCLSSDDQYIAYEAPVEEDSGNYDIYLLAADGSSETPLIKHSADDRLLGWARGRKEILFLSDRAGTWDAWVIKVEDGKPQNSPRRVKSEIGRVLPVGFAQDGSFYFSVFTRWFNIYIATLDLTTGKLQAPLDQPLVGSNLIPEWSPDGGYLAYISERLTPSGSGSYDNILHIRSLKTGEEREFSCGPKRLRNPCWSPDGRYILFSGWDIENELENYQGGLYLIDVLAGNVKMLLQYAQAARGSREWEEIMGAWSPDGQAVFYVDRGSILMRELETGREKQLYRNPDLHRLLALSPDGESLLFSTIDVVNYVTLLIMYISGPEGREPLKLKNVGRIRDIAWAPDGEYVLFTKREKRGISLWRISHEGGESQKLWELEKDLYGMRVHPDGQKIAFYTIEKDTEVWVMENFLPEIKDKP